MTVRNVMLPNLILVRNSRPVGARKHARHRLQRVRAAPLPHTHPPPRAGAKKICNTLGRYDGGVNPDKAGAGAVRHELAAVEYVALALDPSPSFSFCVGRNRCCCRYETNVLGTKGPRVMKLYIPSIKPDGSVNSVPQSDSNGLVAQYRAGNALNTAVLINKPPKWSDSLGAYCLNFKGRVTVASVKNFQMCYEDNVEPVLLQV